jgi:hypothetical protein
MEVIRSLKDFRKNLINGRRKIMESESNYIPPKRCTSLTNVEVAPNRFNNYQNDFATKDAWIKSLSKNTEFNDHTSWSICLEEKTGIVMGRYTKENGFYFPNTPVNEPDMTTYKIAWIKWYRDLTGCNLKDAVKELTVRLKLIDANWKRKEVCEIEPSEKDN